MAVFSGLLLLHQLLNSPLVLKLLNADGITAVASAVLDFAPLAQGLDQFSANDLKVTAAHNQLSLPSDARLNVKVRHPRSCSLRVYDWLFARYDFHFVAA